MIQRSGLNSMSDESRQVLYSPIFTAREMLTWTPKLSLESLTRVSGQTGQRGGRGCNVSDISDISPTTARHISKRGRKAEKGSMVRAECVESTEIWLRGP
jgi:hypothetical protein